VLLEELGSGGYAQAFKAVDVVIETIVCIKLFKDKGNVKQSWANET